MQPQSSLSELMNSLDAATYFFVNSTGFITITAILFFILGLWSGRLLWRRYKKRFHEGEEVIDAFKREVALLKRRIAEQSTRHSPGMGPSPLQAIAFKSAAPKTSDEADQPQAEDETVPDAEGTPAPSLIGVPASRAFTLWTINPNWNPLPGLTRNVSSVTGPAVQAMRRITGDIHESTTSQGTPDVFMVPRSKAFTLWTSASWKEPLIKPQPAPAAKGFTLWTSDDFVPQGRTALRPSQAHTIWTQAGWTSSFKPGPPLRSSRAFTLWTEEGWEPKPLLPWSKAFSVWTEEGWAPASRPAAPLPASKASSVWTDPDFVPACRGPVFPSLATSVWTDAGWVPPAVTPQPLVPSRAFSLWLGEPESPAPLLVPEKAAPPAAAAVAVVTPSPKVEVKGSSVATPDKIRPAGVPKAEPSGKGFFARALAAAKQALGIEADDALSAPPHPHVVSPAPTAAPAAAAPAPEFQAKEVPAKTESAPLVAEKTEEAAAKEPEVNAEAAVRAAEPMPPTPEKTAKSETSLPERTEEPKSPEPSAPVEAAKPLPVVAVPVAPEAAPAPVEASAKEAPAPPKADAPATTLAAMPVNPDQGASVAEAIPAKPSPPSFAPAPLQFPELVPMPLPEPAPARTAEPAKVSVKSPPISPVPAAVAATLAATAAAVEALRQTGRVPVMSSLPGPGSANPSLPPSKAFTVWTQPPQAPVSKITQRIALAALIESKIATGKIPVAQMMAAMPTTSMVPPVPVVVTGAVPPLAPVAPPPSPVIPLAIPLPAEPLSTNPAEGQA